MTTIERPPSGPRGPDRLPLRSPDSAVARLHQLPLDNPKLFGFLRSFQHSTDPTITALYGPLGADRLEKIQYDVDLPRYMAALGTDTDIARVQISTWGAAINQEESRRGKLNEDAALVVPFGYGRLVAAVFDGASSRRDIEELKPHDVKGSWYVSHLASLDFPNSDEYLGLQEDPSSDAYDFVVTLNTWLKGKLERIEGVDYTNPLYIPGMAATIAVIDYNTRKVDIAHVADTLGVAEYDEGFEILTNDRNARFDEETHALIDKIVADNLAQGIVVNPNVAKMDPRVRAQLERSFLEKINTPDGTGILNGQPELVTIPGLIHTASIDIPTDSGLKLHLVSDGIHSLWTSREDLKDKPDLQIRKLLGALDTRTYNPRNPISSVADRLRQDTNGFLFRRGMDDATRVTVEITPVNESTRFRDENLDLLENDSAEIKARVEIRLQEIRDAIVKYTEQTSSQS